MMADPHNTWHLLEYLSYHILKTYQYFSEKDYYNLEEAHGFRSTQKEFEKYRNKYNPISNKFTEALNVQSGSNHVSSALSQQPPSKALKTDVISGGQQRRRVRVPP